MELTFVPRAELKDREWDTEAKLWDRPKIDRETLQELNRRSTSEGMLRLIVHMALIVATAGDTTYLSRWPRSCSTRSWWVSSTVSSTRCVT